MITTRSRDSSRGENWLANLTQHAPRAKHRLRHHFQTGGVSKRNDSPLIVHFLLLYCTILKFWRNNPICNDFEQDLRVHFYVKFLPHEMFKFMLGRLSFLKFWIGQIWCHEKFTYRSRFFVYFKSNL